MALHKYDPPELAKATASVSTEGSTGYETPCKSTNPKQDDSPISIMSDASRRDLNEEFEATVSSRPTLVTGATGWGDDSSDDDDDELL